MKFDACHKWGNRVMDLVIGFGAQCLPQAEPAPNGEIICISVLHWLSNQTQKIFFNLLPMLIQVNRTNL